MNIQLRLRVSGRMHLYALAPILILVLTACHKK
jgi:hypothetical protein